MKEKFSKMMLSTPKFTVFSILLSEFVHVLVRLSVGESSRATWTIGIIVSFVMPGVLAPIISITYKKLIALIRDRNRELERTAMDLRRRTQELEDANRMRESLFSVISHDIRSPLTTLSFMLEILESGDIEADHCKSLAKDIKDHTNSLMQMTGDVLSWSMRQNTGFKIEKQSLNLNEVIQKILALYKIQIRRKGLTVDFDVDPELKGELDQNVLSMVMRNLISNAIKFSHENGVIKIRSNLDATQEYLVLEVRDFGVGMTDEQRENILSGQAITSELGTQGESGHGIGMTLIHYFIKKMSGSLHIDTKVGEGTRFQVFLKV